MSNPEGLADVQARLRQFTAERGWGQFHDAKNLAMTIASEAGELLAELRWVNNTDADAYVRREKHRTQIEHEVADVAIALLLFCDRADINFLDVVSAKIDLNAQRYPVEAARGKSDRPTP